MSPAGRSLRGPVLLFLVSGGLGLGYQVLWSKLVLSFVGVGSYSVAVVLAAFMAGLAIGSRWIGPLADRVAEPLRLLAFLELGVGLYAVVHAPLVEVSGSAYLRVATAVGDTGGLAGIAVKAILAGLLLLPPTILMGGTYPAMVRHATPALAAAGRRASQLYAVNAFGACLGATFTAFVLLPLLGIRASILLLALGNAFVGVVALLLCRPAPAGASVEDLASAASDEPAEGASRPEPLAAGGRSALMAVLFAVGAIAFAYEVAWTRYFSLVLGSSTYSFALIVTAFISGIAIAGAILAKWMDRTGDPLALLGRSQMLASAYVLLTLPACPLLPWAFGRLAADLPPTGGGYATFEALKLGACWLVMLPPSILLGTSIPLAIAALASDLGGLARETGRAYAWNTAGNVLGALVAGLVLLPALGTERLLRACAVATAIAGLSALLLALARKGDEARTQRGIAVTVVLALAGLAVLLPPWKAAWFTFEPFRREATPFELARRAVDARRVLFHEDDPAANVVVLEQDGPEGPGRALLVNGKPDASTTGDMFTQVLLGDLPCLVHPHPSDALVIGLASGVTCGAVLRHDVERVDVVDIVRAMPEASSYFDRWSGAPLDDPRVRFIADDARSYLSTTSAKYDLVLSEPSNPWVAGVGSLFSIEMYERAGSRLKPGGIYCQWVQSYELGDANLASILATVRGAFPHVMVLELQTNDLLVLASREPVSLEAPLLDSRLTPAIREHLEPLRLGDATRLQFLQVFSEATVDWIAANAPAINTDDNLLLEHEAPRDLFLRRRPTFVRGFDERGVASASLAWTRSVLGGADPTASLAAMATRHVGSDVLYEATLAAARRAGLDLPDDVVLDVSTKFAPPAPTDDSAEAAMRAAVRDGSLASVMRREWMTLAQEAWMSPERAERWQAVLAEVMQSAAPAERSLAGRLRADVLAASGRRDEALAQLVALSDVAADGDLALAACRLGDDACRVMATKLAGRPLDESVRRYFDLRRALR